MTASDGQCRFLISRRTACAIFCASFLACLPVCSRAGDGEEELRTALAEYMGCFYLELMGMEQQELAVSSKIFCLAEVYEETDPRPYWVTPTGPGPQAQVVLCFLRHAEEEGLDPANYEIEEIGDLFEETGPGELALLDALLTCNLIKYIHDVRYGRIRQPYADPRLFPRARAVEFRPRAALEEARSAPDLGAYLAALPPVHTHYNGLKKALALYRSLEQQGGWQAIAAGKSIHPGEDDRRIPGIIDRLRATGDLLDPAAALETPGTLYNDLLEPSVRRFQSRHGLDADGVIGEKTIEAMNVSAADRVRQIVVNMTRWRWQDHELGETYILVNIAGFTLSAFRDGREAFSLPVIVGKLKHQTPVFSDRIAWIEINPYWNVPESIACNEELPDLQKDPRSLVKRRIRLFDGWGEGAPEIDSSAIDWSTVSPAMMARYRLRQDPGQGNALGRLKFVFPNPYSVYLHDTPTQNLFARSQRDFSHGCIRVSDPVRLAAFVLEGRADEDWPEAKIESAIDKEQRVVIRLSRQMPVHITYQTARFDSDGIICFNNDVYGRDEKLRTALFGP